MYTFEDFMDRLQIQYDYRGKIFKYKYYPEDNELWVNGKHNYLKITDDEIIIRVNENSYDLNSILSKFKDLETISKYRNWNVYKFKYYLNDVHNSLVNSVSKELINKLNRILIKTNYQFNIPLDYIKFSRIREDGSKCFYEIKLCRDDEGYFYTIESSDRRGYEKLIKDTEYELIPDSDRYEYAIIIR